MAFEEFLTDLVFPEAARWHDGELWFSDMHGGTLYGGTVYGGIVYRADATGRLVAVAEVPASPAGLGWLPDGRLLVVSMHDRRLLRLDGGNLVQHADLSGIATWHCNDMVVDAHGRAYVGNFGGDTPVGTPIPPADIALVQLDGTVGVAATGLEFPNGAVISPDGRTFTVAETRSFPPRLSQYDVREDGTLTGRRILIEFATEAPDGICLDAAGGIWVASPFTNEVVRVNTDGVIDDRRSTGTQGAYSCALGGDDGRTLYVCVADTWMAEPARRGRSGRIIATRVAVPA